MRFETVLQLFTLISSNGRCVVFYSHSKDKKLLMHQLIIQRVDAKTKNVTRQKKLTQCVKVNDAKFMSIRTWACKGLHDNSNIGLAWYKVISVQLFKFLIMMCIL